MTKPTIRLVRPAKTMIRRSVLADHMCLLQLPGYQKRDKQELLSCWVDVQADLSLCWLLRSYSGFCRALAHFQVVKGKLIAYVAEVSTFKRATV